MTRKPPSASRGMRRSAARLAAVQALYQLDIAGGGPEAVVGEFNRYRLGGEIDGKRLVEAEPELFGDLVLGVTRHRAEIDGKLAEVLSDDLPIERLEMLLQAILRAGAYEILIREDIDPPLTISEYVDVANSFFVRRESTMVNSVLDRLARTVRPAEMGGGSDDGRREAQR